MKKWLLFILLLAVTAQGAEKGPKNVLLIISDDQGYCELGSFLDVADPENLAIQQQEKLEELRKTEEGRHLISTCFDATRKSTPNLDLLAEKGMRFTRFYAAPTCGPSRAALMSARYPQRFGVYANFDGDETVLGTVEFPIKTFAEAGYRTGIFGKWHLGSKEGAHPNDKGFDTFFGYDMAHTEKYDSKRLFRNREKAKAEGWLADQITNEALVFLDECEAEKKPFFLYLATCEPKAPRALPPQQYQDAIGSGIPAIDCHFGCLYGMDFNIGRVFEKLKSMGVDDNTMIIFASDNGINRAIWQWPPDIRNVKAENRYFSPIPGNGQLRGCKWHSWEGGVRTPMIAYVPNGVSGTSDSLQQIIDIMPTTLHYAGLKTDIPVEGKSFLGQLTGQSKGDPTRTLFWAQLDGYANSMRGLPELAGVEKEFLSVKRRKGIDFFPSWYVRTGKWKLVAWCSEPPLLFNIDEDPGETINLAEKNPEVVSNLKKEFSNWMTKNKEPNRGKKENWNQLQGVE